MLVDIEIGHPYLASDWDVEHYWNNSQEFIRRSLNIANYFKEQSNDVVFHILIDDQDVDIDGSYKAELIRKISDLSRRDGIENINISFESSFSVFGDLLISLLREKYLVQHGSNIYLGINTGDPFLWADPGLARTRSIKEAILDELNDVSEGYISKNRSQFLVPLKEPQAKRRKYGCSLLTSIWYLNRLGVEGFRLPSDIYPPADRIENVLPIKYIKSDSIAVELLRLSNAARVRKSIDRMSTTFVPS